ncbi:MAG: Ig-like domain-containing protein [Ignavibacteriales bacterium]|nr:Ig-like domain-containing protein [Ignavibacteriales bacterium]
MKKIILLIGLALLSLSSLQAQSLAGYKIYINPGHGGHDPANDREIKLSAEVTFWESEGNLAKGLYLKTMLETLGAKVFISRITNFETDDLPLSQIAELANANNVDYFHSIHSNATGTANKANSTLILFRGYDSAPVYPNSKTMATIMVSEIKNANRTLGTSVRGDWNFYPQWGTQGLGVLRNLNMPGTLSEGSFHDYTPESWRLKSESYLKHEAWAIARSFLKYFNGGDFKEGIVAGIVRDMLETVPTSYSPLTTNDRYKPINNVKVKLEPGGKTYGGDSYNNGYYFFDGVTPGNYKVIVEVDRMRPDTATVIVKANESVFSDRLMTLNPILEPPKVVNYSPADSIGEVSNVAPVVIDFDIRMNAAETQNAVSISPAVDGSFKWDTDFKKLTFTPSKCYVPGGRYTVKVSTAAKTHFGFYLEKEKAFSFTTRSKLNLVSIYPKNGATDISKTVLVRIAFEKGINAVTLAQKIFFTDSLGVSVPLTVNQAKYSQGIIEFEPKTPLTPNSLYKVVVKEGIGDVEFVYSPTTYTVEYRTEKNYTFTGNVLEGFEAGNVWQAPSASPNTKGINTSLTSFSILSTKPKSGSFSGRLEYSFSGKDGEIEIAKFIPIPLGNSSAAEFGVWVFGDASGNTLEYRFIRENSTIEKVKIDTLNWTGWKLKKITLNQIPGTGSIQFKSISVTQSGNGSLSGRVYFDECLSNIITDVYTDNSIPSEFRLEQNYPNPFNPSTTIKYSVSKPCIVQLKVFDILGREVETLVDEYKQPGVYNSTFYTLRSTLTSGVYFYRLQAGSFSETKKMLLIK